MGRFQRNRSGWLRCIAAVAWLLGAGTGIVMLIGTLANGPLRQNALAWIEVEGKVLESRVVPYGRNHRPRVIYEYTPREASPVMHRDGVMRKRRRRSGQIWENRRSFDSAEEAQEVCDRYPAGATIPVYYRRHTKLSVLDRRLGREWLVVVVHAALGTLCSLGLRWQLRSDAEAYLEGQPRPTLRRDPRPMRAAEPGEVYNNSDVHGRLRKMTGRTKGYREF